MDASTPDSKRPRTDPAVAVEELEIGKIEQLATANANQDEEHDAIENARFLLDAWSTILKRLSPISDSVDAGKFDEIRPVTLAAITSVSRALVEHLHLHKNISAWTAGELLSRFDKQLREASFMPSMLRALRACQRSDPQTLTPFYNILVASPPKINGLRYDAQALEQAWRRVYQGKAHQTLLQSISADNRVGPYGCMAVIYQASGYGKSRTVHEISNLVTAVPINLRSVGEELQGAYPPRDKGIADIFESIRDHIGHESGSPALERHIHHPGRLAAVYSFFGILFRVVRETIEQLPSVPSGDTPLPSSWNAHLDTGSNRSAMYDKVYRNWFNWKANKKLDHTYEPKSDWDTANSSFKQLLELVYPGLKEPVYAEQQGSQMDQDIAKPFRLAASSRVSRDEVRWLPPHTVMPFDCHGSLHVQSDKLVLNDVAAFSFLIRFGRPLWWSFFESLDQNIYYNDQVRREALMHMVCSKIMANTVSEEWAANLLDVKRHDRAGFAILDIALNLDYKPLREPTLQADLTAKHLRTAFSAPQHREYFYSGYPSEPIVSLGAMRLLDWMQTKMRSEQMKGDAMVHLFSTLQSSGAIDMGQRGENVGKMLITRAYMKAVRSHMREVDKLHLADPQFTNGCPLITFLDHLFAANFKPVWTGCVPNNTPAKGTDRPDSQTLKDAFANAWVRFTHFVRASDNSAMTTAMAWIAAVRGMAIIGWRNQTEVDVMIPIILNKDSPISEQNVTVLLIQFKLQAKAGTAQKYSIDVNWMGVFPTLSNGRLRVVNMSTPTPNTTKALSQEDALKSLSRPYITLLMELGVRNRPRQSIAQEGSSTGLPTPVPQAANCQSPPRLTVARPPTRSSNRNVKNGFIPSHRRYALMAYGCSSKTYSCIDEVDQGKINGLLHVSDLLHETPRPTLRSDILRMKPFWGMEPGAYSWVDEPHFPKSDDPLFDEYAEGIEAMGPGDIEEDTANTE